MSHKHPYGPVVPDAGDDLLGSWDKFVESAGLIASVSSRAQAQTLLRSAAGRGKAPTPANPLFLNINGVVFYADGSHWNNEANGDFVLVPINYVDTIHVSSQLANNRSGSKTANVAANGYYKIMNWRVTETAPYRRSYLVIGTAWTGKHPGAIDLELYPSQTASRAYGAKARINGNDDTNTQVMLTGIIEAGQQADFAMYLHCPPYNSQTVALSDDEWTNLYIQLTPAFS